MRNQFLKKVILFIVFTPIFLVSCNKKQALDAQAILDQSIKVHDPSGNWSEATLNLHIQEPRRQNPQRYSIVTLNNANQSFKLKRNREQSISEHIIDEQGNSVVLLDGKEVTDTTLIKKYRLDPARNKGYMKFYQLLLGIPMSLNEFAGNIGSVTETTFNDKDCYQIEVELKEPMISDQWFVYISKENNEVQGVDLLNPDAEDGGDRIYFDQTISVDGILIPRIRHWHELKTDNYSGSDLIVKELE